MLSGFGLTGPCSQATRATRRAYERPASHRIASYRIVSNHMARPSPPSKRLPPDAPLTDNTQPEICHDPADQSPPPDDARGIVAEGPKESQAQGSGPGDTRPDAIALCRSVQEPKHTKRNKRVAVEQQRYRFGVFLCRSAFSSSRTERETIGGIRPCSPRAGALSVRYLGRLDTPPVRDDKGSRGQRTPGGNIHGTIRGTIRGTNLDPLLDAGCHSREAFRHEESRTGAPSPRA